MGAVCTGLMPQGATAFEGVTFQAASRKMWTVQGPQNVVRACCERHVHKQGALLSRFAPLQHISVAGLPPRLSSTKSRARRL